MEFSICWLTDPPNPQHMENNHKFFMCLKCVLDHHKGKTKVSKKAQNDFKSILVKWLKHMENDPACIKKCLVRHQRNVHYSYLNN